MGGNGQKTKSGNFYFDRLEKGLGSGFLIWDPIFEMSGLKNCYFVHFGCFGGILGQNDQNSRENLRWVFRKIDIF